MIRRPALPAAALALAAAAAAAQDTRIGSVAAANEDVLGTPPAQERRQLTLGLGLISEERIETSTVGAGQFVFLDQTTLTVWPNSDIVLDRYVYDPETTTGEMAVTVARGALRFIGGRISKTDDVTVTTPHTGVAVRGGIAQIDVTPERTLALHVAGEYTRVGSLVLSRPNAIAEIRAGELQPRFLGVADADAVREIFRRRPGEGRGGLDEPPDRDAVETLATDTVVPLGSGDAGATGRRPVSTLGESEIDPGEGRDELLLADADRALIETTRPAPPPPPPPDGRTPIAGASGGLHAVSDRRPVVAWDGARVTNPASRGVVVGGPAAPLSGFVRVRQGTGTVLEARAADGAVVSFPEASGFETVTGVWNGRPAEIVAFGDAAADTEFHLAAFSTIDTGPRERALAVFGKPTPGAVWSARSGSDVAVRDYALSTELFTGRASPVIGAEGVFDDALGSLRLIPQPDAPILGGAGLGPGADPTGSKWLLGGLRIAGEGQGQKTLFGLFTARVLGSSAGQPTAEGSFVALSRFEAGGLPFLDDVPKGTLDDGAGRTAWGPDGDYLVIGGAGTFLDGAEGTDPDPASVSDWGRGGDPVIEEPYGDTRLARLERIRTVAASERVRLAVPVAGTPLGPTARPGVEQVLTGGFAAAHGVSRTPRAADQFGDPYLLASAEAQGLSGVRLGFAPALNGVVGEFSGLAPAAGTGGAVDGVSLNWGGLGAAGAMEDDRVFGLGGPEGVAGALTGQAQAVSGRAVAAVRGGVASGGLVGDGGIFPADVDADPEYLRWGWWSGEVALGPDADPAFDRRSERLHLGTWVAGVASDVSEVRGFTARYDGHAVAHVIESGPQGPASYVDGGRYRLTFDFDAREGTARLDGILGESLSARVTESGGGYRGDLGGFAQAGSSGSVRGGFFAGGQGAGFPGAGVPGADRAAATAGAFELRRPGAVAAGVFAADMKGLEPRP